MNWGFLGMGFLRSAIFKRASKTPRPKSSPFTYTIEGPSGRIHCPYGKGFSLYFEFGGGTTLACITIPSPSDWERTTGIPSTQRDQTLHAIARQIIADQVSTCPSRYEISDESITIFEL